MDICGIKRTRSFIPSCQCGWWCVSVVRLKYHYIGVAWNEGGGGLVLCVGGHSGDDGWRMF